MTSRGLRQADYLSHMLEAAALAQSYVETLPVLESQLRQIQQSL